MSSRRKSSSSYLRSFTFGVEDSLASTVGLLSGVASAQVDSRTIVLTGLILIITEALSMGVGDFLTEQSVEEYEHKRDLPLSRALPSAFIMFFSYIGAGIVPLAPYVFYAMPSSLIWSIVYTLVALVCLGLFNSLVSGTSIWKHAFRTLVLGGTVAIAGVVIGVVLRSFGG